jgi:hypothetical protein
MRLFPIILTLVLVGTLGERHEIADVGILLAIGSVGYAMSMGGWPRAPLILGFVLGPFLERRLLLTHELYGWSWLLRPTVLALIGSITIFLVVVLRSRQGSGGESVQRASAHEDLVMSAAFSILSGFGLWYSLSLGAQPAFFPSLTFGATLALSLAQLGASVRDLFGQEPARQQWIRLDTLMRFAWLLMFALNAWLLGLVAGTTISTAIFLRAKARESWTTTIAIAVTLAVAVRVLVVMVMNLSDEGTLLRLFGTSLL